MRPRERPEALLAYLRTQDGAQQLTRTIADALGWNVGTAAHVLRALSAEGKVRCASVTGVRGNFGVRWALTEAP